MLKIKGLNREGKEIELVINEKDFDGADEKAQGAKKLFDEEGNLVSEEPKESIFKLHFANGREVYVSKTTYDSLVAKLKIETL